MGKNRRHSGPVDAWEHFAQHRGRKMFPDRSSSSLILGNPTYNPFVDDDEGEEEKERQHVYSHLTTTELQCSPIAANDTKGSLRSLREPASVAFHGTGGGNSSERVKRRPRGPGTEFAAFIEEHGFPQVSSARKRHMMSSDGGVEGRWDSREYVYDPDILRTHKKVVNMPYSEAAQQHINLFDAEQEALQYNHNYYHHPRLAALSQGVRGASTDTQKYVDPCDPVEQRSASREEPGRHEPSPRTTSSAEQNRYSATAGFPQVSPPPLSSRSRYTQWHSQSRSSPSKVERKSVTPEGDRETPPSTEFRGSQGKEERRDDKGEEEEEYFLLQTIEEQAQRVSYLEKMHESEARVLQELIHLYDQRHLSRYHREASVPQPSGKNSDREGKRVLQPWEQRESPLRSSSRDGDTHGSWQQARRGRPQHSTREEYEKEREASPQRQYGVPLQRWQGKASVSWEVPQEQSARSQRNDDVQRDAPSDTPRRLRGTSSSSSFLRRPSEMARSPSPHIQQQQRSPAKPAGPTMKRREAVSLRDLFAEQKPLPQYHQ